MFPLYVWLESAIRLPSLLGCDRRPAQKTTAGKNKSYTTQSLFSSFNLFKHAMGMLVTACHCAQMR